MKLTHEKPMTLTPFQKRFVRHCIDENKNFTSYRNGEDTLIFRTNGEGPVLYMSMTGSSLLDKGALFVHKKGTDSQDTIYHFSKWALEQAGVGDYEYD